MKVTKDTLRQLFAAKGKLDTDTGRIFDGFIGRMEMSDRLYHGELWFSDVGEEPPFETVSIQMILGGEPESEETEDVDA